MSRSRHQKRLGSVEYQQRRGGFNAGYRGLSGRYEKTQTHRHERRIKHAELEEAWDELLERLHLEQQRLEARELARIDMDKAWNDMLERLRLEGGVELVENMLKKAAENIRLWRKER